MKTKKINYSIRQKDSSMIPVEGAQINLFTAARHIQTPEENYWRVDHIQSGSRIFDCATYTEARKIGHAFTQACSRSYHTDPSTILENVDARFSEFLYQEKYKTFEDFLTFVKSLNVALSSFESLDQTPEIEG